MIEKDLAYTAGFLDGEGCIFISHYPHYAASCNNYSMSVSISNTNLDVLLWMQKNYGGCVCEKKAKAYENKKRLWEWSIRSQMAEDFLRLLRPYLKVKEEHAVVALQFRDTYHKGEWRPSKESHAERKKCIQKMRVLMKKGRP